MAPGTITGDPTGDLSDVVAMFVTVGIKACGGVDSDAENANSARKDG